jgi:drug/metabolite transporter (DMT)-like permease
VLGTGSEAGSGSWPWLGNLLIFGAVVGEALFVIFPKVLSNSVSSLATATWVNVLGLVMFLPFSLYEARHFNFLAVALNAWLPILYNGILLTVVAFLFWFRGVTRVPASAAAVFTGIMPISAVLLSYLVLNEPFSWLHLMGALCVLLGIGLIARKGQE